MLAENQKHIYETLCDFAVSVLTEACANVYKMFGPKFLAGDALPDIVLPVIEEFYNQCALAIYSGDRVGAIDVRTMLIALAALPLAGPNHPIDLLGLAVHITLSILKTTNISAVVCDDYAATMRAVSANYRAAAIILNLAPFIKGCPDDHIHPTLGPGDRPYSFTIDRTVNVEGAEVPMSNLKHPR